MENGKPEVRIYAVKDIEKVLADLARRRGVGVFDVSGREVHTERKFRRRVIYYPVSGDGCKGGLLVGVVGKRGFTRWEEDAQRKRYGNGAVVDMTEELRGSMEGVFISLNKFAREQGF